MQGIFHQSRTPILLCAMLTTIDSPKRKLQVSFFFFREREREKSGVLPLHVFSSSALHKQASEETSLTYKNNGFMAKLIILADVVTLLKNSILRYCVDSYLNCTLYLLS